MSNGSFGPQIEFIEKMRQMGAIRVKVDTVEVEFKADVVDRIDPAKLVHDIEMKSKEDIEKENEDLLFWST